MIGQSQSLWQTKWLIIGPRLPTDETRLLGNIVLAKLSDRDFEYMVDAQVPVARVNCRTISFVARYPPFDVVQSRYRLQVDIAGKDEAEAAGRASEIVNRLLLSLSLAIQGPRYRAELRQIRLANKKTVHTAWSQPVAFNKCSEPMPLNADDLPRAMKLFTATENDDVAENAYVHLLTAWQLQDTVGSKPLERSVLQHYVLCIETIVNGLGKQTRDAEKDVIRMEERKFAKQFAEELPERADKPAAIRDASTRLREIGRQNMIPAIDKAALILKIPEDARDDAKALYKFRSRNLSHPGRANAGGMKKWLQSGPSISEFCLAETVARTFLVYYCDYKNEPLRA
tara:strand:+ start:43 stop:1068 length:1026 start_codon:yes stop_codon:yes gene_type:complete